MGFYAELRDLTQGLPGSSLLAILPGRLVDERLPDRSLGPGQGAVIGAAIDEKVVKVFGTEGRQISPHAMSPIPRRISGGLHGIQGYSSLHASIIQCLANDILTHWIMLVYVLVKAAIPGAFRGSVPSLFKMHCPVSGDFEAAKAGGAARARPRLRRATSGPILGPVGRCCCLGLRLSEYGSRLSGPEGKGGLDGDGRAGGVSMTGRENTPHKRCDLGCLEASAGQLVTPNPGQQFPEGPGLDFGNTPTSRRIKATICREVSGLP